MKKTSLIVGTAIYAALTAGPVLAEGVDFGAPSQMSNADLDSVYGGGGPGVGPGGPGGGPGVGPGGPGVGPGGPGGPGCGGH
ncbi:MAG: hypothetical protein ACREYE_27725 [Gammaproteobacteria bacterium]